MWTCPKCGRTFARTNQSHWCGEKPLSVDEYIARQPEDVRPELEQMRNILGNALPDAEERISWSMPTYWQGRNLIHFAAAKHHIGLYPGDAAVRHFKDELDGVYASSKGSIQIPYGTIDADLVTRIARWCLEEHLQQQAGPGGKA
ncbi:MAG: DUF1801 domain-containing protein [Atopobiaceae bacterium]|jgi:uncharacterized protein YdhG (YjbR/CyaY superfamily)|nr:DUF1801 domain-containing protein [Atopobiaceae bacterium]MCI2050341.1 DUF1801 domain-containing protein [Atopobiaceae bacterium]